MTAAWTAEELERIGAAEELQIAPLGLRPGHRVFFEPGENHWHGGGRSA